MVLLRTAVAGALVAVVTVAPRAQSQPPQAPADEPQAATFRSGLDLVSVAVVVRDKEGRIVPNLREEDFEVVDGGERRDIVQFHRGQDANARLALLVDSSGSMVLSGKRERSLLATHLLTAGFGGEDAATVFSFDSSVRRLTPFTGNPETLLTAVKSVEPYGGTCLYDAIVGTVDSVRDEAPRTRAIILLTDGVDTGSSVSAADAARAAAALDVPVYVLGLGDEMRPTVMPPAVSGRPTLTLSDLAKRTGGIAVEASSPAQLSISTRVILHELRHQYTLAFAARSDRGWHPLSVRVRSGRVQARSRDGYLVQ